MISERASVRPARSLLTLSVAALLFVAAAMFIAHRPAAAQRVDDARFAPGAREIFVPALDFVHADGSACPAGIVVQNLGDRPSKGILIYWGGSNISEPTIGSAGPLTVECTGLITPGEGWRLSTAMVPVGARSATI